MKKSIKERLKTLSKRTKIIICCVLCLVIGLGTFFGIWFSGSKGKPNYELWFQNAEYTLDYTVQLEKTPGEEFRILNLTDIQTSDIIDPLNKYTKDTITTLVATVKPHLITVTGDTVWALPVLFSAQKTVDFLDSFGIPWAPVFGNHEGDSARGYNWLADLYLKAENCVFKKGPNNIGGIGNYIVNITENGKVVQSLIMMDSGSYRVYETGKDYDFIQAGQIAWYEWAVNGVQKYAKAESSVNSMLFIHIPLQEYEYAYTEWKNSGFDSSMGGGSLGEDHCPGGANSGMFGMIKKLGSTTHVFAGHDHVNDCFVKYEDIWLIYALKTGDRCYAETDKNGGTVITLAADDSSVTFEHRYIYPSR